MNNFKIIRFSQLDSTNTYAKDHFTELENFSVVIAETQTKGRGRKGRTWISEEKGNLFMSIILKEGINHDNAANITQIAALAVTDYLQSLNIKALIKWPNDVLCRGRKICGILSEGIILGGEVKGIVLGVGLNISFTDKILEKIDKPATSMLHETGVKYSEQMVLNDLLSFFYEKYQIFMEKGFAFMLGEWSEKSVSSGSLVKITDSHDKIVMAKIDGVNPDGTLRVLTADGIRNVVSGDVEILNEPS